MKNVTRILLLSLCASIALTSCNKERHSASDDPQDIPVGFSAMSQGTEVKAGTKATTPLSDFHDDFGVWGIARDTDPQDFIPRNDYILWDASSMAEVRKAETVEGVVYYRPVEDAYWLSGYTYNFIAVAPWEAAHEDNGTDAGGVSNIKITKGTASGRESISFDYDLSDKYDASQYDFDLMAATAQTKVETAAAQTAQDLIFRHLFAKVKINVTFNGTEGSVSKMLLKNVDTDAAYTISSTSDGSLAVTCNAGSTKLHDIEFNGPAEDGNIILILPQDISKFELYLDFEMGGVSFNDFKVTLTHTGHPTVYNWNEWYNWNISISSKEEISFSVVVEDWTSGVVADGDDDTNNDIEII